MCPESSAAKVYCSACLGTGLVFHTNLRQALSSGPLAVSRAMTLTEQCPACKGDGFVSA